MKNVPYLPTAEERVKARLEDGRFISISDLLETGIGLMEIVDAIESGGVYTWDRFERCIRATDGDATDTCSQEHALTLLAAWFNADDYEQGDPAWDDAFSYFGWMAADLPAFYDGQDASERPRKSRPEQQVDCIMEAFKSLGLDAKNPLRGDRKQVENKAIELRPDLLTTSTATKAYDRARSRIKNAS